MLQINGELLLPEGGFMLSPYVATNLNIVAMLVFLLVFVLGPVFFIWCCSRHSSRPKPRLRACPQCAAQNHTASENCYCCGFGFILPQTEGAEATVIQRVRQADDSKKRQGVGTRAVEDKPMDHNIPTVKD
jgi:hypothetical protein